MIYFIIPGLYEHYNLNFRLLMLLQQRPEYFRDDFKIYACYGNFQHCIFEGGRMFPNYKQTCQEEVEAVTKIYNDFGISIRLIFTSNQLQPEHYYNRFNNVVLETCQNGMNEVVISDNNFMHWVKEKYPAYQFISSTTKCIVDLDTAEQELLCSEFKTICLDYNLNKEFEFLNSLPENIKQKTELLANAVCPSHCPHRKNHYKLNSLYNLSFAQSLPDMPKCGITCQTTHPKARSYPNTILPDEMYNVYDPMGIRLMKLEGRTFNTTEQALIYSYYMAKDEYKDIVTQVLARHLPSQPCENSIEQYEKDKQVIFQLNI